MSQDRLIKAAIGVVTDACRIARTVQHDLSRIQQLTKDDKSPVTVADFAVQAIVAMGLNEILGETLITGEEHAAELRTDDQRDLFEAVLQVVHMHRPGVSASQVLGAIDSCDHDATADSFWTLDPIDGTKGFLRGEQYVVALARIEHGQVVLGVLGCPNLSADHTSPVDQADRYGVLYWALDGQGAWEYRLNEMNVPPQCVRAAVYHGSRPVRSCESVDPGHSSKQDNQRVLGELGQPTTTARLDSQCKYALVARGQADAYLRLPTAKPYVEKIWDHAAGMIIAHEAGALVSDITGAPLEFTHGRRLEANRGIVCAIDGLHGKIIEAIERLGIGAAV